MVKLIIHDYYNNNNEVPSKIILEEIDSDVKISHIKAVISGKIGKVLETDLSDDNIKRACEMYILYFGNVLLDDNETICAYNKSNLSEMILFLYKKIS